MSSWICGQYINLIYDNVAEWLNIPKFGDEIYLLRNWPDGDVESSELYKKWFNKDVVYGGSIYATPLPSLHRLLFLFVNNILTPKADIKTNIEFGDMYYLRHLIQKDTNLNITFVILSHMQACFRSTVACLPYPNLIQKIIRLNGIALELLLNHPPSSPYNLVHHLVKIGWNRRDSPSGLPQFQPDGREINEWIHNDPTKPNQYWDPNEDAQQAEPQAGQEANPQAQQEYPQFQPDDQWQYQSPPPIPNTQAEQMSWICQRLQNQHMFNNHILGLYNEQARTINRIDRRQQLLSRRFTEQYGPSTSSLPHDEEEAA